MSTMRKTSTVSRYDARLEKKSCIPIPASANISSPISIKNNRTIISRATIERLATPKHVTLSTRSPTRFYTPPTDRSQARADSAMSMTFDKIFEPDTAAQEVTPEFGQLTPDSLNGKLAGKLEGRCAAAEPTTSPYETLFRLLASSSETDGPILVSSAAISRARQLREYYAGLGSRGGSYDV